MATSWASRSPGWIKSNRSGTVGDVGSTSKTHANWIARNARHEAFRQLRLEHLERFQELYAAERERLQFVTGYEDGRSTPERRELAAEMMRRQRATGK